ncbi:cytoskeletal protein CcmA (bactofilin family) [Paenibacillus castaneae]|uniref:hypothetical protein n=1 Tax=Paenibacillus castaneae TaxID=474957 RepID=UPI000C9CDC86|nr:hypothetical protein [Paenibacillus castaneae]NIK76527.1 cytoskeletal protein CcmA (bactofilin family) [Paenibacillus castaneae]
MNELIRNPLKILGSTTSAGGYYQNVNITGECQFNGDVDCLKMSLTGEARIAGSLRAKEIKITGECVANGGIDGLSLRGRGELKTTAGLRIDSIKFTGNLDVKGECEAEEIQLSGAFNIDGLLSAENLDVSLYGPSCAMEIGGSRIRIKRSKAGRLLKLMKFKGDVMLKAGLIEGDNIELQHTKADMVRGDHVVIGANCNIGTVEYRDTLEIHKSAIVKHQVKL